MSKKPATKKPAAKGGGSKGGGSKVLRIGIIQGGKIIEERKLKRRETVTVGQNEKCSFTVASPAMPKSFELFEYTGSDYYLRFVDGMEGVIQLTDKDVRDIGQLAKSANSPKRGNAFAFKITDESRGKVKFGNVTVLFQFRPASAAPGKLELPPEARGTLLTNIDTQFASIFIAVSISLMSLAAYARNQPYIEPSSIEEVADIYQRMIMPDRDPMPPKDTGEDAGKGKEKKKEKKPEKVKPKKGKGKTSKGKAKPVDKEAAARARREALTKKVAGKGLLGVIGTSGKSKGALSDVFSDGEAFGDGKLSDAFSGIQGVDIAAAGGSKGTRGGGAGDSTGIGDLETSGGGSVETGSKVERSVRGSVGSGGAPEVEGELDAKVIKREMKKKLRALKDCYERQLKRFPDLSGKIVLAFEIQESGKVSNVEFEEDSVGNAAVKQCIVGRARYWRFPKPAGGTVFVAFPLVFTPAG